jgi:hypothetical protein
MLPRVQITKGDYLDIDQRGDPEKVARGIGPDTKWDSFPSNEISLHERILFVSKMNHWNRQKQSITFLIHGFSCVENAGDTLRNARHVLVHKLSRDNLYSINGLFED